MKDNGRQISHCQKRELEKMETKVSSVVLDELRGLVCTTCLLKK